MPLSFGLFAKLVGSYFGTLPNLKNSLCLFGSWLKFNKTGLFAFKWMLFVLVRLPSADVHSSVASLSQLF